MALEANEAIEEIDAVEAIEAIDPTISATRYTIIIFIEYTWQINMADGIFCTH